MYFKNVDNIAFAMITPHLTLEIINIFGILKLIPSSFICMSDSKIMKWAKLVSQTPSHLFTTLFLPPDTSDICGRSEQMHVKAIQMATVETGCSDWQRAALTPRQLSRMDWGEGGVFITATFSVTSRNWLDETWQVLFRLKDFFPFTSMWGNFMAAVIITLTFINILWFIRTLINQFRGIIGQWSRKKSLLPMRLWINQAFCFLCFFIHF